LKECRPEKPVINPNTNRCVNACKDGEERDKKFRCVKTKKNTDKTCKEKCKELNPKTNRCVKPCEKGKVRNEKFICSTNM